MACAIAGWSSRFCRPLKANALADVRFQELATARVCLIVSRPFRSARRQSVSLADAAREPFIGPCARSTSLRGICRRDFRPREFEPRIVEEIRRLEDFSAVGGGTGVAISSTRSVICSATASNCCANARNQSASRLNHYPQRKTQRAPESFASARKRDFRDYSLAWARALRLTSSFRTIRLALIFVQKSFRATILERSTRLCSRSATFSGTKVGNSPMLD
jgi:hypothetical protein